MINGFIFDGAFGTYYSSLINISADPENANIENPDAVLRIHNEYIAAGVNAIKTNTFGANASTIKDDSRLGMILCAGCSLAMEAAKGKNVDVFADIGPILSEDASDDYKKTLDMFLNLGMKNFLFETLGDIEALRDLPSYIKSRVPSATVIFSFSVNQDGYTSQGGYYVDLLDKALEYGADFEGLNCGCGPVHMLRLIETLPINKYDLIAMPNAGYPMLQNGRTVYFDNPEYFSDRLSEIYSLGVKAVGGCCGTTPEHLRAFIKKSASCKANNVQNPISVTIPQKAHRADFNKTIIAVELNTPASTDVTYTLTASQKLKNAGADFITFPDSPLGKSRANSFMISSLVERIVGIRTIPHLCCRDKNQIAIKGDLVGANIEGINNVLVITGDGVALPDREGTRNVFGFNSFKLIEFVKSLNLNVFASNPYNIFAALNINAPNFDAELRRAEKKIDCGAEMLFTQPIFSDENIEKYLLAKQRLNCKIIAGIMPPVGYKNALFLNNEVPGIKIPDDVVAKLKECTADDAKVICASYIKGIIDKIHDNCDGYYIMTQLKAVDYSVDIVEYIRSKNTDSEGTK